VLADTFMPLPIDDLQALLVKFSAVKSFVWRNNRRHMHIKETLIIQPCKPNNLEKSWELYLFAIPF
jgi:hypothetical protein